MISPSSAFLWAALILVAVGGVTKSYGVFVTGFLPGLLSVIIAVLERGAGR